MANRGVHLAPYPSVLAVVEDLLKFWEFIDGHYMLRGVDLLSIFEVQPAWRCFNVIDSIIVDDAVRDGHSNGGIEKARTQILSIYGRKTTKPAGELDFDAEDAFFNYKPPPQDGEFHEGLKITDPSKFKLEPAFGDVDDGISPFA